MGGDRGPRHKGKGGPPPVLGQARIDACGGEVSEDVICSCTRVVGDNVSTDFVQTCGTCVEKKNKIFLKPTDKGADKAQVGNSRAHLNSVSRGSPHMMSALEGEGFMEKRT